MLPPRNTPYSVLPPSLVLACLKDAWSGTEMLKDLPQSSSTTAAASGHIPPAAGPLFSPANTLRCFRVPGWYFCTLLFWAAQAGF